MFEVGWLEKVDDDALVGEIEESSHEEAVASARRLAAIANLTSRRCDKEGVRAHWACDGWDSVAGEVAAAMGVSPKKASSQMTLALALRYRFPKVAILFAHGKVSYRVITAINWHTHLVDNERAMAKIDGALAQRAESWGELSDYKLTTAINYWVNRHDPDAVRRVRVSARSRDLYVGKKDDESETTAIWGRLYATDAAALDRRLMDLVDGVCEDDPRTIAQRRADAMGVLAAGGDRLACTCAHPHCPAAGSDGRASNVVVHVITEAAALDAEPDPHMSGEFSPREHWQPPMPGAALLMGGGDKIVPAPLLAEMIRCGATVREVQIPRGAAESGYRPSAKLEEFIRVRDVTCRFPGCEEPAERCDIDHTIPYPVGPTHPSNLKCLCRKHHLLKTFWTGPGGWHEEQLPDGTVVWTAPTGRTYKTLPG
ncbi:MAG TPA: DUF222 domain-containing protein, partial [Pseudonocardiaceae bacterium]|nr:DUF222 domain-containing protein [Pseudonocardiaceae bacterium]